MNERDALREQLWGVNSHTHVLHALEGLEPKQAGTVIAGAHSIFQVVHHMVYWQDMTLSRLRGGSPSFPESAAEGWEAPAMPEDANDWEAAVASLAEGLRAIDALLADRTFDLAKVVDERRERTAREEILMVQGHNSYHLGVIVHLRTLLGAWPPPRGGDTW